MVQMGVSRIRLASLLDPSLFRLVEVNGHLLSFENEQPLSDTLSSERGCPLITLL